MALIFPGLFEIVFKIQLFMDFYTYMNCFANSNAILRLSELFVRGIFGRVAKFSSRGAVSGGILNCCYLYWVVDNCVRVPRPVGV